LAGKILLMLQCPIINKFRGQTQGYYDPYIQGGQHAGQQLQGQYDQLLNDPGGKYNQIGQSFHESPGFKFALQQALQGSGNRSAAGGMTGSPQHTQQDMTLANDIANQDYYNYMGGATHMYDQGLQGSQGMYNTGFNASNAQANNVSQALAQQGNLAYQGQAEKNKSRSDAFGNIIGGLGSMFF
jgi:hypothetical protein